MEEIISKTSFTINHISSEQFLCNLQEICQSRFNTSSSKIKLITAAMIIADKQAEFQKG
jgi:hypothetical protein